MVADLRMGARALGLEVRWRYAFVGPGSVLPSRAHTVTLDVGGQLAPGVLDQHQDVSLGLSTSDLVCKHPELVYDHLLGPWLGDDAAAPGTRCTFTICTHRTPDLDAVVSTLLVQHLVEDGALPGWAPSLSDIATRVDTGRWRPTLDGEAHAVRSVMMAMYGLDPTLSDEARMRRALALLRAEITGLDAALAHLPAATRWRGQTGEAVWEGPMCGQWSHLDADAQGLKARLESDKAAFDALGPRIEARDVTLPDPSGSGTVTVRCAVIATPEAGVRLLKYWLRAAGYVMTVVALRGHDQPFPTSEGLDPDTGQPRPCRFIIAVDPTAHAGDRAAPSLRGLGHALEEAESTRRREIDQVRPGPPRWSDGSCDNDDPWYDGRGHHHTIVDSPRSGSYLPPSEIIRLATEHCFWE